jgi:hypothetical protein
MITVGRFFAVVALLAAGSFLAALGIVGGISNRLTGREVLAGVIAIAVGAVAALWLRRDKRERGRQ